VASKIGSIAVCISLAFFGYENVVICLLSIIEKIIVLPKTIVQRAPLQMRRQMRRKMTRQWELLRLEFGVNNERLRTSSIRMMVSYVQAFLFECGEFK